MQNVISGQGHITLFSFARVREAHIALVIIANEDELTAIEAVLTVVEGAERRLDARANFVRNDRTLACTIDKMGPRALLVEDTRRGERLPVKSADWPKASGRETSAVLEPQTPGKE